MLFTITPNLPTETLVLNSYETFSSVRTLLLNLSNDLTGEHRDVALAIHQLSELGVLLVGQMMDREMAAAHAADAGQHALKVGRSHDAANHKTGVLAQTARRLRPLARRAAMTARPPRVFMRTRKP